ncbi:MAG: aldehyde dehydrogenase family protein [Thermoplasmata archaeon]
MAAAGPAEEGRVRLLIAGELRDPGGGEYRPIVDPSTGRSIGEAAVATPEDARAAVEAAAAVEERWGLTPGHARAAILRRTAARLRADAERLARGIALEVGKPIGDARAEVERAASVLEFAAEEIRQLTGETFPADAYALPAGNEHRLLLTLREPIGTVVAIAPFNFPLNLLAHKVAPALAAGNPVVAKPTSNAPRTALRLAEHLAAAGLPAGALNLVVGPGASLGEALVGHPRTRLVTFTGSTEVGRAIAGLAGRRGARVLLELGGMDPIVVWDDADLPQAVAAAVRGSFLYAGQVCTASKRLLVHEAVAARFVAALAERTRALRVGPATDEGTEIGPVIDRAAVDRLGAVVAEARDRGAAVVEGGRPIHPVPGGFYFAPTILDRVPPEARVVTEEPFGPIAPVVRCAGIEEAARLANATDYGLQASIYTRDLGTAFRLARAIRAGSVHINDPTNLRWDALPFGGVRASGLGREGLRWAMQEMTELKLVSVNHGPRPGGSGA